MTETYDAIVVGARCAGSPTAMLLARKGYRVLVVDRSSFPSDTLSTHLVHPPGVAAVRRWGLLDQLASTGCPPIRNYSFDFGPFALAGAPEPLDGVSTAYCARRTILDKLLVDAAVDAGAEVREQFTVDELLFEDGSVTGIRGHGSDGTTVIERARVVIGADGRYSMVARAVEAPVYHGKPTLAATYYTYWSGVPVDGVEVYIRPERTWGAAPTHDGLTMLALSWPQGEAEANRHDIEGNYLKSLELAPEFAERVRAGRREARFRGTGDMPNFFRQPFGRGWALVGDAGYHKDPCTAQGISDGFSNAELLAEAIDAWLTGACSYDDAMAAYQRARDEKAMPMFELTCQLAAMEPPPPDIQQLLGAIHGNQEAMDGFASVIAGTVPVPEFFSPDNVGRIMAAAGASAAT